jgi:dihydroorotase
MKDLIIKGGRIIDPANKFDSVGDILVQDGVVKQVGTGVSAGPGSEIIDARGKVVCPGFIDLHCHLRQPGYEAKETIATGTRAAAKGGFTTVCCMPNTNPPLDNLPLVEFVKSLAEREGSIRVLPIGCITRGRKGEELSDMAEMARAGVVGFSDDGNYVKNARLMKCAMEYSLPLGLPIIEHCEDPDLAKDGQMNEGIIATRLGLCGIPTAAEEVAVARDILLAQLTGAHLHIAHVSTKGSVELLRWAKQRGIKVTGEVAPHHLTMTEELVLGYNTAAKVNPPLRTRADIESLIEGLNDGTIDIIATDHAPHTLNDKLCEFEAAASGISGLETMLGSLMKLVDTSKITLPVLIAKLTSEPGKLLGGRFGSLKPGVSADITILDPEAKWTVDAETFTSKGKNTPLDGETLKGKVICTVFGGAVVFNDGQ